MATNYYGEDGPIPIPPYEEWIPCVRCGKRNPREICDECMTELDRYAAESLRTIATEEEIDEWCWQHDIERRNGNDVVRDRQ